MKRVNIAIASPGDVVAERDAVPRVFNRWNDANGEVLLHPVMWESASVPALGDHPQHILNRQIIDKSDLLVAILWSKLGTPTPTASSGTVEEIREFIKCRGAGRVMLYFCCRDLPYDTDLGDFAKLREFKAQMRSEGLFHEYTTRDEFEKELYRHLDMKVRDFLDGQLPVPSPAQEEEKGAVPERERHPDARLHEPIDFGTTLEDIAKGFSARMDAFDKIDSAGADKFLDLGAHVYSSCATCLDRFLAYSAAGMASYNRLVIERVSARLKQLTATSSEYAKGSFPQFWKDGREICDQLVAHVAHVNRLAPG